MLCRAAERVRSLSMAFPHVPVLIISKQSMVMRLCAGGSCSEQIEHVAPRYGHWLRTAEAPNGVCAISANHHVLWLEGTRAVLREQLHGRLTISEAPNRSPRRRRRSLRTSSGVRPETSVP